MNEYKKNSLSLTGAVSLGTGVMIGAGAYGKGTFMAFAHYKIDKS